MEIGYLLFHMGVFHMIQATHKIYAIYSHNQGMVNIIL
jgi:hypothetical protein